MVVTLVSIALWSLVTLVLARLACIVTQHDRFNRHPITIAIWGALMLCALILLMRPHEDIFGGQDTGAYPNMGARLGREHRLLYEDPLLTLLPLKLRHEFFYYNRGELYPTEYGSGAVLNVRQAIAGNWFQPAMAILMSLPASIGGPHCTLYTTPLFAILTALALAALSTVLIPRRGVGLVAAISFLACPIVLWHGRAPRPEVIASFLLFSGATLLVHAWCKPRWRGMRDIVLGASCISLAPLFHAIAWSPAGITAMVVVAIILTGRTGFMAYAVVASIGFGLFLLQITMIVDTYSLTRFLHPIINHGVATGACLLLGLVLLTVLSLYVARKRNPAPRKPRPAATRWGGPVLATLILIASSTVYVYARMHPPSAHRMTYHFLYPTDLPAVLNMVGIPIGVLALIGLVALALRRPGRHRGITAAVIFFGLFPALSTGYIYDFFLVRYTLVSLLPLMALGLASLVSLVPDRGRLSHVGMGALAVGVCITSLVGRTHLATAIQYEGFSRYIQDIAAPIREENGIVLCEYSRIAAPFDHFCGIPTLGINNERITDYSRIEKAWTHIMTELKDRPAYFITPFKRHPASEAITFEYIDSSPYQGSRLISRRWELPQQVGSWGCNLRRYRMRLAKTSAPTERPAPALTTFGFDPGNMGVRNFANCRTFNITVMGQALEPGTPVPVPLPRSTPAGSEVWLLLYNDPATVSEPSVVPMLRGTELSTTRQIVAPNWWLLRVDLPTNTDDHHTELSLTASQGGSFLTTARLINKGDVTSLFDGWLLGEQADRVSVTVDSRWARTGSSFKVPKLTSPSDPQHPSGYLCTLVAGPEEVASEITLGMGTALSPSYKKRIPTGIWLWEIWPLVAPAGPRRLLDVRIETDTPFNPHDARYPNDLAVLMAYVSDIPSTHP